MSDQLYAQYSSATGALMMARKRYGDICANQGAESWAAEQAQEYLIREIEHRDLVRELHDAADRQRAPGLSDG